MADNLRLNFCIFENHLLNELLTTYCMKRSSAFLLLCLITLGSFAQAPEKFFYQAIARDAGGALIVDAGISIRLTIVADDPLGTPVYQELHAATTTFQGLINLEVGSGLPCNRNLRCSRLGFDGSLFKSRDGPVGRAYFY